MMKNLRSLNKISQRRRQAKSKYNFPNSPECYIHDQAKGYEKDIHETVCVKHTEYPFTKFDDGKYYCLFHLPTRNKDIEKFEEFFQLRLSKIKKTIAENEKLIKNGQEPIAVFYSFQFVWFPSNVNFLGYAFDARVCFRNATFSRGVDFAADFKHQAEFHNANFIGVVTFAGAKFRDGAYFLETVFSSDTYFSNSAFYNSIPHIKVSFENAIFLKEAYFKEIHFFAETSFKKVIFEGNTYFNDSKFLSEKAALFSYAKFERDTHFDNTEFHHDVSFNSAVFGQDSDLLFKKTIFEKYVSFRFSTSDGFLRFIEIKQGENNRFNFQEAIFDKAKRVLFNKARLRLSWFINSEAHKIQFINCKWDNVNKFLIGVKDEIRYAEEILEIDNAEYFLKEAVKQLVISSEELNRYEEASLFRKTSLEIEKYENKRIIKNWFQNGKFFQEQINCSPFSTEFYRNFKFCAKEVIKEIGALPSLIIYYIYHFLSGYGESPVKAAFLLIIMVLFIFPLIYTITDFQVSPRSIPLEVVVVTDCNKMVTNKENTLLPCDKIRNGGLHFWNEAILHSLTAATFQDVEHRKPISCWAEFWTILEKILAPLQAALLALAIRRKFMR